MLELLKLTKAILDLAFEVCHRASMSGMGICWLVKVSLLELVWV